jgi:hypothetical protein
MDGEDNIENPSPTNMEGMDDEMDMGGGDSPGFEEDMDGGAEGGSQEEGTEGEAEDGVDGGSQEGEAGGPTGGEDEEVKAGDASPASTKKKKSRGMKRGDPAKAEKT